MSGPRFYAALAVIALGAIALGLKGALNPLAEVHKTPIAVPLREFPMEIAGWSGTDRPLNEAEIKFIQPDDHSILKLSGLLLSFCCIYVTFKNRFPA